MASGSRKPIIAASIYWHAREKHRGAVWSTAGSRAVLLQQYSANLPPTDGGPRSRRAAAGFHEADGPTSLHEADEPPRLALRHRTRACRRRLVPRQRAALTSTLYYVILDNIVYQTLK